VKDDVTRGVKRVVRVRNTDAALSGDTGEPREELVHGRIQSQALPEPEDFPCGVFGGGHCPSLGSFFSSYVVTKWRVPARCVPQLAQGAVSKSTFSHSSACSWASPAYPSRWSQPTDS